jgi:hypothetical protein
VAKDAKLLAAIRANPRNVRFGDACRAARLLGFVHEGGSGSHRVFKRKGEPVQLTSRIAMAMSRLTRRVSWLE